MIDVTDNKIAYFQLYLAVKCPAIKLSANSIHLDKACNGMDSTCTSVCRIGCKKGYTLIGQNHVTCHGSEQWTGKLGYCKGKNILIH